MSPTQATNVFHIVIDMWVRMSHEHTMSCRFLTEWYWNDERVWWKNIRQFLEEVVSNRSFFFRSQIFSLRHYEPLLVGTFANRDLRNCTDVKSRDDLISNVFRILETLWEDFLGDYKKWSPPKVGNDLDFLLWINHTWYFVRDFVHGSFRNRNTSMEFHALNAYHLRLL